MKTCNKCGATKPLDDFFKNGKGRKSRRAACKACERKTADSSKQRQRAVSMWEDGYSIRSIALFLHRHANTVTYWLKTAGIDTSQRAPRECCRRGDPEANARIGSLPRSSKWAELDAVILQDRLRARMPLTPEQREAVRAAYR